MDQKLKITGLWRNETRSGEEYYAGTLSPGVRVLIFQNNRKASDRDPDMTLYLAAANREPAREDDSAVTPPGPSPSRAVAPRARSAEQRW